LRIWGGEVFRRKPSDRIAVHRIFLGKALPKTSIGNLLVFNRS
jgi:hypothetical protein